MPLLVLHVLCRMLLLFLVNLQPSAGLTVLERTTGASTAISDSGECVSLLRCWLRWRTLQHPRRLRRPTLVDKLGLWQHREPPRLRFLPVRQLKTPGRPRAMLTCTPWTKVCAPVPGVRTSSARCCAPSEHVSTLHSAKTCHGVHGCFSCLCHGRPAAALTSTRCPRPTRPQARIAMPPLVCLQVLPGHGACDDTRRPDVPAAGNAGDSASTCGPGLDSGLGPRPGFNGTPSPQIRKPFEPCPAEVVMIAVRDACLMT